MMFGFGLFDGIKLGAAALAGFLAGAGIFYPIGHWRGDAAGYERAQTEARDRAMELIKKRNEDNAEISDMDVAGICSELGGVWLRDENRCD